MVKHAIRTLTTLALIGLGSASFADGHATSWTLDGDNSKIAFGSVKKDTVGEVHAFEGLSGSVTADGAVSLDIDLTSVETFIDIRNERMVEHVFNNTATATLMAEIDMSDVSGLAVGETSLVDVEGVLSLVGTNIDIETEMFVARLSDTQVMVTTSDMIMLSVGDAGLTAGIDKLMELAKLPGITRVSPVTMRLIFNADEQKAEAAPAAPVTNVQLAGTLIEGDAKKGKKAFRKCKACHSLKEGKNGAGPSLYGIFGRTAGTLEGWNFSGAMVESGIVWEAETLAAFLTNPKDYVAGTSMSFRGFKKEEDVANLLTYLAEELSE